MIKGSTKGRKCTISGCGRKHKGLGLCDAHYQRLKSKGKTDPHKPITKIHLAELNNRWRGGEFKIGGRVVIYSPGHPYPNHGAYVYRYRLVIEKHIGRYLLPSELVHHINTNITDDRIENLVVSDSKNHARAHALLLPRNKKNGRFKKLKTKPSRVIICENTSGT